MKTIVEKLIRAEREMSEDKGAFLLFAFSLREDAPDLWDLIVSAPWITQDKSGSLNYIAKKVQGVLSAEELLKLSRIVIIEQDYPALEAIHRVIHIEHGSAEILNNSFLGPRNETRFHNHFSWK
ncbi:MAG: hypothetical protein GX433_13945 [Deltaproteobacteria bacterium]|nr:hypothetical protein [Deltaproteobacteria bacterium]